MHSDFTTSPEAFIFCSTGRPALSKRAPRWAACAFPHRLVFPGHAVFLLAVSTGGLGKLTQTALEEAFQTEKRRIHPSHRA